MNVSIVIRTLNEGRHLPALFQTIGLQGYSNGEIETIVVDSGSTDGTLELAKAAGAKIVHIRKEDFSFGRSLNIGCDAANGDVLVFVSGHCIPVEENWIARLVAPLGQQGIVYSYGRQLGTDKTRFSECQIFAKYFPPESGIPQEGFFCNNANSALLKRIWQDNRFDEELTGLEDMYLAKRLVEQNHKIAYAADAAVYHIHNESWRQVRRRFEREAISLQKIMPDIHLTVLDVLRYSTSAILMDFGLALQQGKLCKVAGEVVRYRIAQFRGSYRGNHEHRDLSRKRKEDYFYPKQVRAKREY